MSAGLFGGYVLAGGRSSRMGTDKALLRVDDATLLERAAEAVAQVAGCVVVVGNEERHGGFGYPVIADRVAGAGPLGGIHAALHHTEALWNLIVACDMPGINRHDLSEMAREALAHREADVLIPRWDGVDQPLCAVYHRRALPVLEQALREGRWKIMEALRPLRVARPLAGSAELFRNVNTPEEWSAFVSR